MHPLPKLHHRITIPHTFRVETFCAGEQVTNEWKKRLQFRLPTHILCETGYTYLPLIEFATGPVLASGTANYACRASSAVTSVTTFTNYPRMKKVNYLLSAIF